MLSLAAQHHRQFRLRRGEFGIGADADRLARAHADARRAFEEDLRPRLAVHVSVHAFARAVLGIAEAGAGLVGAAAGPDFRRMRSESAARRGSPWRLACVRASSVSGIASASDALNQAGHRVAGNRPRHSAFEDGGGDAAVPSDLSESHDRIQYFR